MNESGFNVRLFIRVQVFSPFIGGRDYKILLMRLTYSNSSRFFQELFSNEKKKIIELLFNHTMLMAEADNKTSKTLEIASFISAFDKILKLGTLVTNH